MLAQQDDDPDLPKNVRNIDKEVYLKNRADYIAQKRGLPHNLPYDPRVKAIEEKIKQEADNRNNPNFVLSAPNWVAEGPFPIPNGQTTTNSVAVSGRVTAIAVHPTNANTIYVGTANGGVYRSMDGGSTWTAIFDNAQSIAIGALALAPSSPTTLYVGTGEAALSADSYFGVGLYRIDNADVSPTLVGPINPGGIFTFRSISKILIHPTDPATIFVSTASGVGGIVGVNPGTASRGIYRSTNATAAAASVTFSKLTVATANSGNRSVIDMVMEPGTPNNIVCTVYGFSGAGDGGIYRSTDALAATPTFTRTMALGTAASNNWRCELAICKVGATTTVYAGLDTAGNAAVRSIQKSTDGGATWAPVTASFGFCGGQCFYDIALAVDPNNANNFYIGGAAGNNIFRYSTDGGTSFTISNTNLHADVHSVVVAPSSPTTIYLGCDGGIFKSTNSGVTWASMNTAGFSATQFQSVAIHPIDTKFSIAGAQDNGTSMYKTDGTWNRIDFGDGGYTLIDQNATNTTNVTMYHTYFNQTNNLLGLARVDLVSSAADGLWPFYGCGGTANGIGCANTVMFYAPIALGPGNPNTVYYGSDRLYRSTDKAVTMTVVSQAPIVSGVAISCVGIAKQDDNYRIVGLTNGQVWATSTGSSTLENITPAGAPAVPVQRVTFDPNNKNIAYISYGGYGVTAGQHIWKTSNFNVVSLMPTWAASGTGIPDVPVNGFAIDPANSNIIYAGTDIGVYASTDAGASWASFSTGLPIVPVFDMAVHPVSHNLRIATHGRGLWSTTSVLLPVSLTSFNATARDNGTVYLEWITQSEQNNKGFEIERALETAQGNYKWETIGFVNGSINSTTPKKYYFQDEPTGGDKFVYRLKQVDLDGKFKHSDLRLITLRGYDYGLYSCYPNPVQSNAVIKYKIPTPNFTRLSVYDNTGKLVRTLVNETKGAGVYQVKLSTEGLASGVYYYRIEAGGYADTKSFTIAK
ncbi:MAG: T9SS type A sorting domain-containing protein [Ferruginibacter sp.]